MPDVGITFGPGDLKRLLAAIKVVRPGLDLSAEATLLDRVTLTKDLGLSIKLPDGTSLTVDVAFVGS